MADVMQGGFLRRDTDGALIVVGSAVGEVAEVKFASVNATADGANTVVAAVTGKKIRVLGFQLAGTGAGTIEVRSGAAGAVIGRILVGAAGGGASYAGSVDAPAFETAADQALVVFNPVGVDTLGHVTYVEV